MIQFQNWYEATLTSPITSTSLNIPLTPVPPIVTEGILVIDYDNPSLREIIHFTSKDGVSVNCPSTGDTGTLNTGRGYEQTTARNHAQNAKVRMVLTAGVASAIQTAAAVIANQNNNGGWVARSETPVYASNNGQREFTFTVPGDLTGVIWQGMKLKMDRVVAPPTQAMSFTAASSQYATKASPTGITFTSAFTVEAWVYLNSYTSGGVVERRTSTDGWYLEVNATGTFSVGYHSASSFTTFTTYQSLPLKRWVHVVGTVTSASLKTAALYINGVSVPFQNGSNTNTTLPQAGSLAIGCYPVTPGIFFDGFMSEVRLWSVAQTATQIRDNMFINLIGNEANLVFCARGAGDWTDRTVNANTLTPTNGATFVTMSTLLSSYFNATEQFIVNGKPTYNAPNTTITAFGGTDFGLPSSGGLTNFYFSSQRAPYGFPASKGKWIVEMISATQITGIYAFVGTWYSTNMTLNLPIGEWNLGYNVNIESISTASGARDTLWRLSPTVPSGTSTQEFTSYVYTTGVAQILNISRERPVSLAADTAYTFYTLIQSATGTETWFLRGEIGNTRIYAECAYI